MRAWALVAFVSIVAFILFPHNLLAFKVGEPMVFPVHPAWDPQVYQEYLSESSQELKAKWSTIRTITAYSSSRNETDESPFETASMSHVRYGIVAANWLPVGTKLQIPEIFGDEVFVVEDRMNKRYPNRVDVWMPSKQEAKQFGKKTAEIVIVE